MCKMEYYSAFKWGETDQPDTTGMNLEDIMQVKESNHKKDNYCMIPLSAASSIVKIIETESRRLVTRDWG